jgi:hypothetical protein
MHNVRYKRHALQDEGTFVRDERDRLFNNNIRHVELVKGKCSRYKEHLTQLMSETTKIGYWQRMVCDAKYTVGRAAKKLTQ